MNGTSQEIQINSFPDSADVYVNNIKMGSTPLSLDLPRDKDQEIKLDKKGFKASFAQLTSSTSSWMLGNIFFLLIPGLLVDIISGGGFELTPSQVNIYLKEGTGTDTNIYGKKDKPQKNYYDRWTK